jgi:hypothetical protein
MLSLSFDKKRYVNIVSRVELGAIFFHDSVCICGNHIFQVQKMKKFVPKIKIAWLISMSLHQCFFFGVCKNLQE